MELIPSVIHIEIISVPHLGFHLIDLPLDYILKVLIHNGFSSGEQKSPYFWSDGISNGQIAMDTPVPARSPKLSIVEPGQYLDGWPFGNTWYCNQIKSNPSGVSIGIRRPLGCSCPCVCRKSAASKSIKSGVEPLRQFDVAYNFVLAAPATALVPNCNSLAVPLDPSATWRGGTCYMGNSLSSISHRPG